jgi:hypothetical protein
MIGSNYIEFGFERIFRFISAISGALFEQIEIYLDK